MKSKILQAAALIAMAASAIVAAANHTGRVYEKCDREWKLPLQKDSTTMLYLGADAFTVNIFHSIIIQ
jgi:hypothetical protein